jgi:hypothetical protein
MCGWLSTMKHNGKSIGEVREKDAENEQLKLQLAKNFFVLRTYNNFRNAKSFFATKSN